MISAKRLEELRTKWKRLNSCHWINLHLRLDGQDIHEEGDWIKEIYPLFDELKATLKVVDLMKEFQKTIDKHHYYSEQVNEVLAPFAEEKENK